MRRACSAHGFALKGESESSIWFEDDELRLAFVAERYYGGLSTWVTFVGDPQGKNQYRLDLVMGVMDGATFVEFASA